MEATLFSGWIYDTLKPFAAELQMGHPAMMKAIGASKKKGSYPKSVMTLETL
jgi:transposase